MGYLPFWKLVKRINGKEVIRAIPPDDWLDERDSPAITDEELDRLMKQRPEPKEPAGEVHP